MRELCHLNRFFFIKNLKEKRVGKKKTRTDQMIAKLLPHSVVHFFHRYKIYVNHLYRQFNMIIL